MTVTWGGWFEVEAFLHWVFNLVSFLYLKMAVLVMWTMVNVFLIIVQAVSLCQETAFLYIVYKILNSCWGGEHENMHIVSVFQV